MACDNLTALYLPAKQENSEKFTVESHFCYLKRSSFHRNRSAHICLIIQVGNCLSRVYLWSTPDSKPLPCHTRVKNRVIPLLPPPTKNFWPLNKTEFFFQSLKRKFQLMTDLRSFRNDLFVLFFFFCFVSSTCRRILWKRPTLKFTRSNIFPHLVKE